MVTKKGEAKPVEPIEPIKPGKPKGKPMLYGYKVLKRADGVYVSAIETRLEQKVAYGAYAKSVEQVKAFAAIDVVKPIDFEVIDTKIEYKSMDPKQRVLVFGSIKNATAFQKLLSYSTDVWLCEVKDPIPMQYLLQNPSAQNASSFWDKAMTGMAHGVYRNLPPSMKLFVAPPGTISVKSIRLIKRVA